MANQTPNSKQIRRPDKEIMNDIWQTLLNEDTIRSIDFHDISVAVEDGQVCLSGHVSKDHYPQRIEEITRSIPGVTAIHNHLVTDRDLSSQVSRALGEDETTRLLTLPLSICHGWVELGGSVPNHRILLAAEATAASVSAVRGVILVPAIAGEYGASARDAVQPRIGVRVFGKDATLGMVYQVVINPQNRLVTHAIVRVNHCANGWQEPCDYLIPVEEMDIVDEGGIILTTSAPAIHEFPIFSPADYPFAPFTWQPPYPYAVGSVRWPHLAKVKPEQRSTEKQRF